MANSSPPYTLTGSTATNHGAGSNKTHAGWFNNERRGAASAIGRFYTATITEPGGGTPPPPPPPPPPSGGGVVFDQGAIGDPDGTAVADLDPETDLVGTGWAVTGGTWQVNSADSSVVEVGQMFHNVAQFDTGLEDIEASFDLRLGRGNANGRWNGVVIRSDGTETGGLYVRGNGTVGNPRLRLYDGTGTVLATWPLSGLTQSSPTSGSDVTIKVVAEGDVITVFVDGELLDTHTLLGTAHNKHGEGSGATFAGWYNDERRDAASAVGRFYSATVTDPNAAPPSGGGTVIDYDYDAAGNRSAVTTNAIAETFAYDARNRLETTSDSTGTSTYSWDPRGTLASIDDGTTVTDYTFDALGRLDSVDDATTVTGYSYDAHDRLADRNGTQTFNYSGLGLDPVADAESTVTRSPAGRIVAIDDGTNTLLAGLDRHGDLTALFTQNLTVDSNINYDPFGQPETGTAGTNFGFQGDWTDPDTGDVWMGARWYTPATATFRSRDTILGQLATPVTLNRYTYANNNPLAYFDPDGRCALEFAARSGQDCYRGDSQVQQGSGDPRGSGGTGVGTRNPGASYPPNASAESEQASSESATGQRVDSPAGSRIQGCGEYDPQYGSSAGCSAVICPCELLVTVAEWVNDPRYSQSFGGSFNWRFHVSSPDPLRVRVTRLDKTFAVSGTGRQFLSVHGSVPTDEVPESLPPYPFSYGALGGEQGGSIFSEFAFEFFGVSLPDGVLREISLAWSYEPLESGPETPDSSRGTKAVGGFFGQMAELLQAVTPPKGDVEVDFYRRTTVPAIVPDGQFSANFLDQDGRIRLFVDLTGES